MSKLSDSVTSDTVFVGKGEFQIKDIYVRAEVEVCSGTICKVRFSSPSGGEFGEAKIMTERLTGQRLSEALAVNALENDAVNDRPSESPTNVAILEAFHRAVEACFDSE